MWILHLTDNLSGESAHYCRRQLFIAIDVVMQSSIMTPFHDDIITVGILRYATELDYILVVQLSHMSNLGQ